MLDTKKRSSTWKATSRDDTQGKGYSAGTSWQPASSAEPRLPAPRADRPLHHFPSVALLTILTAAWFTSCRACVQKIRETPYSSLHRMAQGKSCPWLTVVDGPLGESETQVPAGWRWQPWHRETPKANPISPPSLTTYRRYQTYGFQFSQGIERDRSSPGRRCWHSWCTTTKCFAFLLPRGQNASKVFHWATWKIGKDKRKPQFPRPLEANAFALAVTGEHLQTLDTCLQFSR